MIQTNDTSKFNGRRTDRASLNCHLLRRTSSEAVLRLAPVHGFSVLTPSGKRKRNLIGGKLELLSSSKKDESCALYIRTVAMMPTSRASSDAKKQDCISRPERLSPVVIIVVRWVGIFQSAAGSLSPADSSRDILIDGIYKLFTAKTRRLSCSSSKRYYGVFYGVSPWKSVIPARGKRREERKKVLSVRGPHPSISDLQG